MPYSVIIGDTEGRAKSLSRSSGSVLKQKREGAPALGCVRNCAWVFVRHVVVRVSRVYVFVCGYRNFTCASIPRYAPTEKDIIGEGHRARFESVGQCRSNTFGNAARAEIYLQNSTYIYSKLIFHENHESTTLNLPQLSHYLRLCLLFRDSLMHARTHARSSLYYSSGT